jgi:hypothetical protein
LHDAGFAFQFRCKFDAFGAAPGSSSAETRLVLGRVGHKKQEWCRLAAGDVEKWRIRPKPRVDQIGNPASMVKFEGEESPGSVAQDFTARNESLPGPFAGAGRAQSGSRPGSIDKTQHAFHVRAGEDPR